MGRTDEWDDEDWAQWSRAHWARYAPDVTIENFYRNGTRYEMRKTNESTGETSYINFGRFIRSDRLVRQVSS